MALKKQSGDETSYRPSNVTKNKSRKTFFLAHAEKCLYLSVLKKEKN